MKNSIHIIFIISLFILSITTEAFSQDVQSYTISESQTERLEEGLIYGLSSDVSGVVESALFNMISYKVEYPEFSSDKVIATAAAIAEDHPSERVQKKAQLAVDYYTHPDNFPQSEVLIAELDYTNQDRIFDFLQRGVNSGQFTSTQE
ncbi:hypothetical protein [Rhodohalobacter halophilus]|uniref:hypothetical protein n=1 Tax=Rhodohalobacter halophilus TaxID=1812810 RepID=UPI00083F5CDB|nr:hypothetical protein [Rhodohalobacter halophilus]